MKYWTLLFVACEGSSVSIVKVKGVAELAGEVFVKDMKPEEKSVDLSLS